MQELSASLCTTYFATPIIHSAVIMDIEKLHNDIRSSLPLNPISTAQLPSPCNPKWTLNESGLLRLNDQIFVPDIADLRLKVLQNKHDHILAGHVRQNKPLKQYIATMFGLIFVLLSRSSVTLAPLAKDPNPLIINLTDF